MNKEHRTVPPLRFKGYTDVWQQQKFSKIALRNNKITNTPNLPAVTYDDIVSNKGILNKEIKELQKGKKGIFFDKNYVLYGKLRPYLHNYIVPNFKGSAVGDFWVFKSSYNTPYFLYYLIQTEKYNYISNLSIGSKMPRADWNLVSNSKFSIPIYKMEQERIGALLLKVDNTITLLQRKAMLLNKVYNGLVDVLKDKKIMYRSHETPFTTIVIGEAFKVTRGKVLSKNKIKNQSTLKTPYPVYSSQTQNNGLLGYYKNFLFENAITWTTDGANAGTVSFRRGKFFSTNVNGVLLPKKLIPDKVIAELLNRVTGKYVARIGNPKLMNNTMSEIKITIPNSALRIFYSDLLEKTESSILKLNKKLNLLHKFKKFLLQNMFI